MYIKKLFALCTGSGHYVTILSQYSISLISLKTTKKTIKLIRFSDSFRGCRNGTFAYGFILFPASNCFWLYVFLIKDYFLRLGLMLYCLKFPTLSKDVVPQLGIIPLSSAEFIFLWASPHEILSLDLSSSPVRFFSILSC